jgi:hypothetical protein
MFAVVRRNCRVACGKFTSSRSATRRDVLQTKTVICGSGRILQAHQPINSLCQISWFSVLECLSALRLAFAEPQATHALAPDEQLINFRQRRMK